MPKFYILIIEDLIKSFSIYGSGQDCKVIYSAKGALESLSSLNVGDRIVGYVSTPKCSFCYLFDVQSNPGSEGCVLTKVLELSPGLDLGEVSEEIKNKIVGIESQTVLVEIEQNSFNFIVSKMMQSCSFCCNETSEMTKAKGGMNKIFYGAPGCGKSHYVSEKLKDASVDEKNIVRVTFHPEYANCDFIGQIIPTVEEKTDEKSGTKKELVKYIFNPGPFTLALERAYNTTQMVYLVIEEINRGNAAAIFGDMFQLLDRVRDESNQNYSSSEYPVTNPNMQKYLIDKIDGQFSYLKTVLENGVFIPSNLTIYATMNSSDQNVFTMDTAFKRRWAFQQISNDIEKDDGHEYKKWYIPGTDISWEKFLTKLNAQILEYKIHNQTNEDKRLGKYFVTKECLTEAVCDIHDVVNTAQNFAYKVLEYIWNDVCKIGREEWFNTNEYMTLEDLINAFINPKNGQTPLAVFQNIDFQR